MSPIWTGRGRHRPRIFHLQLQQMYKISLHCPSSTIFDISVTQTKIAKRIRLTSDHLHFRDLEPADGNDNARPVSRTTQFFRDNPVTPVPESWTVLDFAAARDHRGGDGDNWNSKMCKTPAKAPSPTYQQSQKRRNEPPIEIHTESCVFEGRFRATILRSGSTY